MNKLDSDLTALCFVNGFVEFIVRTVLLMGLYTQQTRTWQYIIINRNNMWRCMML
ncbi:hypothetical protein LINPERHAP1_LOCUS17553 [Linum perenne]